MDEEAVQKVTLNTLRSYRQMAQNSSRRARLLKDTGCLSFLVYVLDDKSPEVVLSALQIILLLTERPEQSRIVADTYGLMPVLKALLEHPDFTEEVIGTARRLHDRLSGTGRESTALRDLQNSMENLNVTAGGGAGKSETSSRSESQISRLETPKSKAAFRKPLTATRFMGVGGRAKTLTYHLDGPLTDANRYLLESKLVPLKGVISIYFDMNSSRCVVRAKLEVKSETVAATILQTGLFIVHQVIKLDDGQEILMEMLEAHDTTDKENMEENHQMPDYLPEEFGNSPSPKSALEDKRLARTGHKKREESGWWGSVSSFISNSFYW